MPRIAICAPAGPLLPEVAEKVGVIAQEFPSLQLYFHDQCFLEEGHFAGPESARLAAFLECANDPAFDAVWFARGGYGSAQILAAASDGLAPAAGEKTYLGYSDMGYLLAMLYGRGIGRPVHGPMVTDVRREGGDETVRRALAFLAGDRGGLEPTLDGRPTVAFNLMTLAMLAGTEFLPDLTGHVVIVEEVSEHLYAVDRLFFHIANCLGGIAGLRLGDVTDVPENDRPFGSTAQEIAEKWCARAGIPFLGRAEIGHTATNRIVPFGLA
ncbi:LD-carboxypeptidase [Tsuneonella sp. HG222]